MYHQYHHHCQLWLVSVQDLLSRGVLPQMVRALLRSLLEPRAEERQSLAISIIISSIIIICSIISIISIISITKIIIIIG